jgi:hypothetical protein
VKRASAVILWAVAFAFVEASVVEYLRALYYPVTQGGFTFPVQTLDQLHALGDEHVRRMQIELGRELATLVMLAMIGALAARNRREFWAYFMIAFGVWDIFFYLWLKLFLDWPGSLFTWDLLFLLPVPWVGPVIAPVLISVVMIGAGFVVLHFEERGQPLLPSRRDWIFVTLGGILVIVAFCWDFRNIMNGGFPSPFNWPLFGAGLLVSAITFLRLVLSRRASLH